MIALLVRKIGKYRLPPARLVSSDAGKSVIGSITRDGRWMMVD
jgi:hypothetical protein